MRTVKGLLEHPQLAARARWRAVGSPAGPLRALLPPGMPADTEPVMAPIPAVGEHTDAILGELGYDEEAIVALRREAAI
jgi:itaconate CoA-transferase